MSDPLSPNTDAEPAPPQQAETAKPRCCPSRGCGGLFWVVGALLIALALGPEQAYPGGVERV
jgi:hypothetical protein